MSRSRICLILLILPILMIANSLIACSCSTSIIGWWQDAQTGNKIEFLSDGRVILDTNNQIFAGRYGLISDNYVEVELEGVVGALQSLFGKDKRRYEVECNSLTLEAGGTTLVFERFE